MAEFQPSKLAMRVRFPSGPRSRGVAHTSARAFLWAANKQGGFDNLDDTVDGLREILGASFRDVEVEVVGLGRAVLSHGSHAPG